MDLFPHCISMKTCQRKKKLNQVSINVAYTLLVSHKNINDTQNAQVLKDCIKKKTAKIKALMQI